jgi:urease accessory protein
MTRTFRRPLLLIAGLLGSGLASAHTGVDASAHHGVVTGFMHPLTGTDHLAAMLAVGLWSAVSAPAVDRRMLRAPITFALMLLAGALLGDAGVSLPAVEPMIAASVLVLGLLAASRQALSAPLAALLVGGFAVFHGVAHGAELSEHHGGLGALIGMVAATALLHGVGLGAGALLRQRSVWLPRVAGLGIAAFGASLLVA